MSKKSILFVVGVIILFGGLVFWYFASRPWLVKNYPSTTNGPVLMFGDSLVEGAGAENNTLPQQLGRLTNTKVLNYGVSGDTTRDGVARLDEALAENPKIAIILLGGNDFLKKIPRAETFQNLAKMVTAFQSGGAIVMVVGVRSGLIGGGADAEYEALAKNTGAVYVSDVLVGIFAHPELMSDAIHPNALGYGKIAERLAPLLKKYLN